MNRRNLILRNQILITAKYLIYCTKTRTALKPYINITSDSSNTLVKIALLCPFKTSNIQNLLQVNSLTELTVAQDNLGPK